MHAQHFVEPSQIPADHVRHHIQDARYGIIDVEPYAIQVQDMGQVHVNEEVIYEIITKSRDQHENTMDSFDYAPSIPTTSCNLLSQNEHGILVAADDVAKAEFLIATASVIIDLQDLAENPHDVSEPVNTALEVADHQLSSRTDQQRKLQQQQLRNEQHSIEEEMRTVERQMKDLHQRFLDNQKAQEQL